MKIQNNDKKLLEECIPTRAKWISYSKFSKKVLRFEKKFNIDGNFEKACIFISGLGYYNAEINKRRINEGYFSPAVTDYGKRELEEQKILITGKMHTVIGNVFDVTDKINNGENVLNVEVGDGYYQNDDKLEKPNCSYGIKKLIFELRVINGDGENIIYSDENTLVSETNAMSSLFLGDSVDFSAKPTEYTKSKVVDAPDGAFITSKVAVDALDREIKPEKVIKKEKSIIYDFGINHSGVVVFRVKGERGRKIVLRFAEVLNKDGTLNMETGAWEGYDDVSDKNCRIDQTNSYILSGETDEIKPLFSWRCYRYMEIEDAETLEISDLRSLYIHTKIDEYGEFSCSESIFNDLHIKARRTTLNCLHSGLLEDCPHREKRPYTGDGQIMAETIAYDLNAVDFLDKWLDDIINAQTNEGFVPYTAPYLGGGGGYAWSNAITVVPNLLYSYTGGCSYILRSYNAIKSWLNFCENNSVDGVVGNVKNQWCLSDWMCPEMSAFNIPYMNTLVYYEGVLVAEKFARILEIKKDIDFFAAKREFLVKVINEKFFDKEKVQYCNGIQGENILPLYYKIVPKEYEKTLAEKTRYFYEVENGCHLDTGVVVTPYLINYLTDNGMVDIAYKIMTQTTYPSYAYMMNEETTLLEHWSKKWPDYKIDDTDYVVKGGGVLSHCHPMFGSVVAWLYKRVAGIDLSSAYLHIIRFKPTFTDYLESARASVFTENGRASISWNKSQEFFADLVIPSGFDGVFEYKTDKPLYIYNNGNLINEFAPTADGKSNIKLSSGSWRITQKNK